MEQERFEDLAQEAFDALPDVIREKAENVHIVVEDYPTAEVVRRMRLPSRKVLLGLYEGVPLTHRGTSYGAYPVVPDKITLYRKNIEAVARTDEEIRSAVRDTLIHEVAHHYGMNEDEVRRAGY
jgi:predicted Zn-dependent protease with MMP-like domain